MSKVEKFDGLIGSLNDSCFVHVSDCLIKLCQMISAESGTKPSLDQLCAVLVTSLRCCPNDLLSDVDVQAIEKLTPKLTSREKHNMRPGDVFAVSREQGGYYFVIYITSNRFGEAFGIFRGHGPFPTLTPKWEPVRAGIPVYTGRSLVVSGSWRKIDHRKDLLELFPVSPEIYHGKSDNPSNDSIGPYGSAETAAGELRVLDQSEARQIGLIQGTYRQVMLEEQFEAYLRDTLG